MDKENKPQRRASLRGKGREILLGQQADADPSEPEENSAPASPTPDSVSDVDVDAAALDLTVEEADALLDLSPEAAVYDADATFPEPPADAPSRKTPPQTAASAADPVPPDMPDPDATLHDWVARDDLPPESEDDMPGFFVDEPVPVAADARDTAAPPHDLDDYPLLGGDAVPLAERTPEAASQIVAQPYRAHPAVEALGPRTPETWGEGGADGAPGEMGEAPDDDDDHNGGAYAEDVVEPQATARALIPDPFTPTPERPPADEVFAETAPADGDLLTMLVNDERIQRLAAQIDALHEEIAEHFHGDQQTADAYQKELLQASSMLMASRENYDDARAIVYRVRTDMNRRRNVDAAIERYRPVLLLYYIGWGVSLVVLFLLKALFTGVTDAVGIETAAAMYFPMLFGVAGALLSGVMTLERHTTRLRDFDPIHISWYMLNPFLGGVMGLLMFLLASIANEDLLRESASDAEHAITYLLCVVAGMNQNNVLRQLNDLLKRFGRGGDQS